MAIKLILYLQQNESKAAERSHAIFKERFSHRCYNEFFCKIQQNKSTKINGEIHDHGLESLTVLRWPCTPNPTNSHQCAPNPPHQWMKQKRIVQSVLRHQVNSVAERKVFFTNKKKLNTQWGENKRKQNRTSTHPMYTKVNLKAITNLYMSVLKLPGEKKRR